MVLSPARAVLQNQIAVHAALGPVDCDTTGLSAQGTGNKSNLGTTAFKMLAGSSTASGKSRRCKLVGVTADRNVAWATVARGATAPVIKADGDGSADEGTIIMGGGGAVEYFSVLDHLDLYVVASAASTAIQLTVVEV